MTQPVSPLPSARPWWPSIRATADERRRRLPGDDRATSRLQELARAIALAGIVAVAAADVAARTPQVTPPSGGTIDTVAVEGTIDVLSPGTLTVKAIDGTTQFFRLLGSVFVHGTAGAGDELKGLQPGMTVVVHYSGTGPSATAQEIDRLDGDGLRVTEGRVTKIDRERGEIKIRLDDNHTDTLKLSNRVSHNVGKNTRPNVRVIIYYTDRNGVKEVHYFKQK